MKNRVIKLSESQLVGLIKKVVKEQQLSNRNPDAKDYLGLDSDSRNTTPPLRVTGKPNPKLGCIPPSHFRIKGEVRNSFKYTRPDGEYLYYDDGDVWLYDLKGTKRLKTGKWVCGNNNLEVRWDNDPKAINYQPLPKDSFAFGKLGAENCAQDIKEIYRGKFVFMGCRGNAVKEVQKLLNINDDGVFGGATRSAVINYQKSKGIKPDGVVGRDTLSFLLELPDSDGSKLDSQKQDNTRKALTPDAERMKDR